MTESGEDSKMSEDSYESLVSEASEAAGAVGGVDLRKLAGRPVMDSDFNFSNGGKTESIRVVYGITKIVLIGDEGCGKSTLVQAFNDCRPRIPRFFPPPSPSPPPENDGSPLLSVSPPHESHQSSSPEEQMPHDEQPEPENLLLEEQMPHDEQPEPENLLLEEQMSDDEELGSSPEWFPVQGPTPPRPFSRTPSPNANLASQECGARLTLEVETVDDFIPEKFLGIKITDVPGSDKEADMRPPVYRDAKVILVCFAIDDPVSLVNAELKWIVEANRWEPTALKILVGLKQDLRTNVETIGRLGEQGLEPISSEHGLAAKARCHVNNYIECSAVLPYHNVLEVFEMACLATDDNWISVKIVDSAEAN